MTSLSDQFLHEALHSFLCLKNKSKMSQKLTFRLCSQRNQRRCFIFERISFSLRLTTHKVNESDLIKSRPICNLYNQIFFFFLFIIALGFTATETNSLMFVLGLKLPQKISVRFHDFRHLKLCTKAANNFQTVVDGLSPWQQA